MSVKEGDFSVEEFVIMLSRVHSLSGHSNNQNPSGVSLFDMHR